MKIRLVIGLLVTLTLFQSILCETEKDNSNEDINYDEDDYDTAEPTDSSHDANNANRLGLSFTTAKTTIASAVSNSSNTIKQNVFNRLDLDEGDIGGSPAFACPEQCNCTDDTKFINCSNHNLTSVPKNLPNNVYKIDLSNNLIENIETDDFANCTELRELMLASNRIQEIDKEVFANLQRLENIDLSANRFTHIDPDTFTEAKELRKLSLNRNPITIPDDGPLLNLPEVEELHLRACNFSELNEKTFANLEELQSLDISGNLMDEFLDKDIFANLVNLRNLKMTNLSETNVFDLCEVLQSIDVINFDKYDVSCFELVSGATFEESIVATIQPITVNPLLKNQDAEKPEMTPIIPTNRTIFEQKHKNRDTENILHSSDLTNEKPTIHDSVFLANATTKQNYSLNETLSSTTAVPTTMKMDDVASGNVVPVSRETINNILLGIIAITVSGLIIGIICRRDCLGIKTKMCRTRRPPPTDQVRPAEEVPLNKISV